jgi:thymidine phosphorylase
MASALGSWHDLSRYEPAPAPIVRDVHAKTEGHVQKIDTRAVGMAVVVLGGGRIDPAQKIDYHVGFDRLAGLGAKVDAHTPIARIHARDEAAAKEAEERLRRAYLIGEPAAQAPAIYDHIPPQGGQ